MWSEYRLHSGTAELSKHAFFRVVASLALLIGSTGLARAQSVTLAWDSNPEPNLAGYTVYVGVTPGSYAQTFDVHGGATTFTFTEAVPGQWYYFSVAAYNTENQTGPRTNELPWKINVGPTLDAPADQAGAVGAAAALQLRASDDGDPLTYGATGLPAGLSINRSTGRITGTPTTAVTAAVTVTVSDGAQTASRTFSWTVAPRLAVTSLTSNVASPQVVGAAVTFTAAAANGLAPYQYRWSVHNGSSWSVVRQWAAGPTYTWTPAQTNSNYRVRVEARSAGAAGDTAEASAETPFVISAAPPPTADSVTPASGSGTSQVFELRYSNAAGASSFSTAWVWFSATFASTSASSCLAYYDRPAARLYLINDAGSGWLSAALGGGTLQNSQCSIALGSSSASLSGSTLTLTLAVTFRASFSGAKNVYAYAANVSGVSSGWQTRGTWTVPGSTTPPPPPPPSQTLAVTADSSSPNSGSGATQLFTLQYTDTAGATDLATAWVWFNATFASTSANSCLVYYDRLAGVLRLINNGGTGWIAAALGDSGTLQNSQCSIALAGTSASLSGTTLTLRLALTFSSTYGGAKNIYMYGASRAGVTSGWQTRGSWTVPSSSSPTPPPPPPPATPSSVTPESITPNAGAGNSAMFTARYLNSADASSLVTTWIWFNPTFASTAASSCLVYYNRPTNQILLLNDAGTTWMSAALGNNTMLRNTQCTIEVGASSVALSGSRLTLNLAVSFTAQFSGAKNIYMYAANASTNSGWHTRGSWVVE